MTIPSIFQFLIIQVNTPLLIDYCRFSIVIHYSASIRGFV